MAQETQGDPRETTRQAQDEAKQAGRAVTEAAAARSRTFLEDQKQHAADRLEGFAGAVRSTADRLESESSDPQARGLAPHVQRAADRMQGAARRLREQDPDSLLEGAESLARRDPAIFLTASMGVGFALARFLKSSSARRRTASAAASSPPRSEPTSRSAGAPTPSSSSPSTP